MASGNTGQTRVGRPPIFESAEKLQSAIDDYFKNGVTQRKVLVGPPNKREVVEIPVPTITGLCYHIGFDSRQSFYDYESKKEFSYTIKRARLFIEKEYEELLQTSGGSGAIFALKNFGWVDKQVVDQTVRKAKPIMGGSSVSDDDSVQEDSQAQETD